MDTLKEKLERIKERVESGMSAKFLKIMHNSTAQLEASGIADRVLGVGAQAPQFELEDQQGQNRNSSDLLSNGPLILIFYRGFW